MDLNGTLGTGTLSQTIITDIGQIYRIDFSLSGNPGLNDRLMDKPITVTWNGTPVGNFVFEHLPTDHISSIRWEDHSVQVTATGSDVLSFVSTGGAAVSTGGAADAGAMIDQKMQSRQSGTAWLFGRYPEFKSARFHLTKRRDRNILRSGIL